MFCKFTSLAIVLSLLSSVSLDDRVKVPFRNQDLLLLNITGLRGSRCPNVKEEINASKYLNGDSRRDLCTELFQTIGEEFKSDLDMKCFDPQEANIMDYKNNPCLVVCMQDPSGDLDPGDCLHAVRLSTKFLAIDIQCGDNHMCDDKGCCVRQETTVTQSPTPETTTVIVTESPTPETTTVTVTESPTPETTTVIVTESPTPETTTAIVTESPTPETTTEIVTEPGTESSTTESTEVVTESTTQTVAQESTTANVTDLETESPTPPPSDFECPSEGDFPNVYNNLTFHRCQMVARVEQCEPDNIFSSGRKACIYDINTPDPSLPIYRWFRSIRCTRPGIFKSPYDCKYYYICVPNFRGFLVHFGHCSGSKVFDEEIGKCVPKRKRCNNLLKVKPFHAPED